jgi:hypothetical protein
VIPTAEFFSFLLETSFQHLRGESPFFLGVFRHGRSRGLPKSTGLETRHYKNFAHRLEKARTPIKVVFLRKL